MVSAHGHDMLKPAPGTSEVIAIASGEDVEKYRDKLQAGGYTVELSEVDVNPAKLK